tara:strand:- start:254 stop:1015 length:762 start_codon:yes stop_codon:yes gene_type:complete
MKEATADSFNANPKSLNKSLVTNSIAFMFIVIGYATPIWQKQILAIGYFALSGAITNWLAIHMLFEKVPGLYGSGIIPNRFNEFKSGIRNLVIGQFFTEENMNKFFESEGLGNKSISFEPIVENIDYDLLFNKLIDSIMSSQFGGMVGMIGGPEALQSMKPNFTEKMKLAISEMTKSEKFNSTIKTVMASQIDSKEIRTKVEHIVQKRLDELTPGMVKEIIQEMIRHHLGWLVVWGGVFGGLIGLLTSFFSGM